MRAASRVPAERSAGSRRVAADVLLVAASVALYTAAYPPLSWSVLAWIALVPLLVVAARASALGALGYGLAWGVGLGFATAGWMPGMIARFFGVAAAASWAASLGLAVALYGVWTALFAGFVRLAVQRRVAHPAVLAAGFGAIELARAGAPVPNPWVQLGASQIGWSALAQSADLAGPFGISMLIAAANACAAGLFVPALRPRRPLRCAAGVALLLGASLLYGASRLGQDFTEGPEVSAALLQDQDRGRASDGIEQRLALTAPALAHDPRLVVWPELALRSSLRDDSAASSRLLGAAGATHADWLVGGPDQQEWATRIDRFNSVFLVRDGQVAGRYDKARLMPFAEENPLPRWLSSWRRPFAPGDPRYAYPLRAGDLRVGILLCSEMMVSARARALVAQGAELLANPAYDEWFGSPGAVQQQLELAQLRAIESRRFVVRAATGGRSAAIDPHGRVVAALPPGASDVLLAHVRASHAVSPYQRWGDAVPFAGGAFAALALAFPLAGLRRTAQET